MSYYKGYRSQRGYGLGNVLGGILRAAIPVVGRTLKGVAKSAGRSLLRSGLQALDGADRPPGTTLFSKTIDLPSTRGRRQQRTRRKITKPTKRGRVQKGSGKRSRIGGHRRRRTGGYKRKRSNSVSVSLPFKKRRKGQQNRRRRRQRRTAVNIFS